MEWEKVTVELQKPLSPDAVKPPPRGKFGEYVDGKHVIDEANRIFGHDGWCYSITRLDMASRIECKDRDGNAQIRVSYACTVRVDVDGVYREGAAVGMGVAKKDNEADAHESAYKEAETDALKRALRTFGNTFGLALYEKDKSKREVGYSADQNEVDAAIANINGCDSMDALRNHWNVLAKKAPHIAKLPEVIEAKEIRKSELER